MKYAVVFDSTGSNSSSWLAFLPNLVIAVLMISLILYLMWQVRRGNLKSKSVFLIAFVLTCIGVGFRLSHYYYFMQNIFSYHSSYKTVEGVVNNYETKRKPDFNVERFEVQNVQFSYSNLGSFRCFHTPATNGGPVRAGLAVRVSYRETYSQRCIVKLEIAEGVQKN
jgi:hypothetical protein